MRRLNTIGILVAAASVAACAEQDAEVPFDPTTRNLSIRGSFTGFELDVSEAEIAEVEREYSPTRLCEVSTELTA